MRYDNVDHVFVYGTLRPGFGNHRLIEDAKHVNTVSVALPFKMYSLGAFPVLINISNETTDKYYITGDIFKVNDQQLKAMDQLEGHPHFYVRAVFDVAGIPCWIYHMNELPGYSRKVDPIYSGDWKELFGEEDVGLSVTEV